MFGVRGGRSDALRIGDAPLGNEKVWEREMGARDDSEGEGESALWIEPAEIQLFDVEAERGELAESQEGSTLEVERERAGEVEMSSVEMLPKWVMRNLRAKER